MKGNVDGLRGQMANVQSTAAAEQYLQAKTMARAAGGSGRHRGDGPGERQDQARMLSAVDSLFAPGGSQRARRGFRNPSQALVMLVLVLPWPPASALCRHRARSHHLGWRPCCLNRAARRAGARSIRRLPRRSSGWWRPRRSGRLPPSGPPRSWRREPGSGRRLAEGRGVCGRNLQRVRPPARLPRRSRLEQLLERAEVRIARAGSRIGPVPAMSGHDAGQRSRGRTDARRNGGGALAERGDYPAADRPCGARR